MLLLLNMGSLANMCNYVLDGGGREHDMKKWVVKTMLWQELQEFRVGDLVVYLMAEDVVYIGLFFFFFNQNPIIAGSLQRPSWGTMVDIVKQRTGHDKKDRNVLNHNSNCHRCIPPQNTRRLINTND